MKDVKVFDDTWNKLWDIKRSKKFNNMDEVIKSLLSKNKPIVKKLQEDD
jgi:hypothetical protein